MQHVESEQNSTELQEGRVMSGRMGVYGGLAPHASPEDKRRRQAERLYERIVKAARVADRVYIFGPGLAKKELEKKMKRHKAFADRVAGLEGADKMSSAQMTARVKEFFGLPRSAA